MMQPGYATQAIQYRPAALATLVKTLPSAQKTFTIGFTTRPRRTTSSWPTCCGRVQRGRADVTVQAYPTGADLRLAPPAKTAKGAPTSLLDGGWPDAAPPYMWAHISFDPSGGLNYLHCSTPQITSTARTGARHRKRTDLLQDRRSLCGHRCWENLVHQDDFMVAPAVAQGRGQAHVVTYPNSLNRRVSVG